MMILELSECRIGWLIPPALGAGAERHRVFESHHSDHFVHDLRKPVMAETIGTRRRRDYPNHAIVFCRYGASGAQLFCNQSGRQFDPVYRHHAF